MLAATDWAIYQDTETDTYLVVGPSETPDKTFLDWESARKYLFETRDLQNSSSNKE